MIFLAQGIEDLEKILGLKPEQLQTLIIIGGLYIMIQLVRLIFSSNKKEEAQADVQKSLIALFGEATNESKLTREAFERNAGLQREYTEHMKDISASLSGVADRLSELRTGQDPILDKLNGIENNLLRNATTQVVIRDSNKKIVAHFIATPRRLKNGTHVLLIDMDKKP